MGAEGPIRHRIFVVGAPRSGTTLVQSLLAAHSQLTSFTESHFFSRHFRPVPGLPHPILIHDPSDRLREFLAENDEDIPAPLFQTAIPRWKIFRPLRTLSVTRRFLALLDETTQRRDCSGWIEKTPRHLRDVALIQRASRGPAQTHFVHVIRQGVEVVASLHVASKRWERAYDLETCVRRWNRDLATSEKWLTTPPTSGVVHHAVVYERLTTQAEEELPRLFEAIGLPWEEEIPARLPKTATALVTPAESWKQDVGRPLRPSSTAHQVLDAEEYEQVHQALDHPLYERLTALSNSPPVVSRRFV